MGATWFNSKKYTTILIPGFTYKEIEGAIDPTKMAIKLDDKGKLNELKNEIINIFSIEKPDDNLWESCRDEVIKKVKEIAENEKKFLKPARIEFESVRCKNTTLKIALRYINQHDYTIEFKYLKIILIDEEGEKFEFGMDPSDEQVYYDENKIFTIEKELSDSKYNAQKHSESIIDFKYDRAF